MRMSLTSGVIAVILLIVVIVAYGTFFTVDQTSQALVLALGVRRWLSSVGVSPSMTFRAPSPIRPKASVSRSRAAVLELMSQTFRRVPPD